MVNKREYNGIRIPSELAVQIDNTISKEPTYTYANRTMFVVIAIREKIEKINKYNFEKKAEQNNIRVSVVMLQDKTIFDEDGTEHHGHTGQELRLNKDTAEALIRSGIAKQAVLEK